MSGGAEAATRVEIPEHVVFRAFVDETVVLNLETGQYHGLNRTAGRMFEVLAEIGEILPAASLLAAEFEQEERRIVEDLVAFCADLSDRGLIRKSRAA